MTQIEYQEKYGTEAQCREYLFNKRWPEGFICPKCGNKEYFNIKSRSLYQCKSCNHQASVTAGTIMDKTRTPLVKWFLAIYLMTADRRGISALALKSRLGISYDTEWKMCHKIRFAMGMKDADYTLSGIVEMDEAFFGASSEGGKRGRETDKTAVIVSVSFTEDGKPQYARMEAVESVDSETVKEFGRHLHRTGQRSAHGRFSHICGVG